MTLYRKQALAAQRSVGLGDIVETTSESGSPVKLRIVGILQDSIFQSEVVLADEDFSFSRNRRPGMPRMHVAQIGRDTRPEADALCARLRTAGADCMVLKN